MRRTLPLLPLLLVPTLHGSVEAQMRPSSTLDDLFRRPPLIVVHPSSALLGGGGRAERRMGGEVWWRSEDDEPWNRGLGLLLGTSSRGAPYSWSGAAGELRRGSAIADFTVRFEVLNGSGDGPAGAITVPLVASMGDVALRLQSTWLREASTDTVQGPGGMSLRPETVWNQRTDAEVEVARHLGPTRFSVTSGSRFGSRGEGPNQWVHLGLQLPLWRQLGLSVSGGVRPGRPEVGQVGGRFAQVGLSLTLRRSGKDEATDPDPPTLWVDPVAPREYRLTVEAEATRSVQLRSDLTDWNAVELEPARAEAERWSTRLHGDPGLYQVTVRIDDGEWVVPRGLLPVPDRFGGTTGLLELPTYGDRR